MIKNVCRASFFFAVVLLFTNCVPFSTKVTPASGQVPLISPTKSPLPTATITHVPTQTAILPIHTMQPELAKETINTLLQQPGDCKAPCFWGITPGKTTLNDARNIFSHFALPIQSISGNEDSGIYQVDYSPDTDLSLSIIFSAQDKVVSNIRILITPEIKSEGIPRLWLAYSPETLINRYGSPSRVEFAIDWGPRSYFEMDMYFDRYDLIVQYAAHDLIPRAKGSPWVCPLSAQFDSVWLWMGKTPLHPPPEAVPLNDAISLTMEEFSKVIKGDPHKACFKLRAEAFS